MMLGWIRSRCYSPTYYSRHSFAPIQGAIDPKVWSHFKEFILPPLLRHPFRLLWCPLEWVGAASALEQVITRVGQGITIWCQICIEFEKLDWIILLLRLLLLRLLPSPPPIWSLMGSPAASKYPFHSSDVNDRNNHKNRRWRKFIISTLIIAQNGMDPWSCPTRANFEVSPFNVSKICVFIQSGRGYLWENSLRNMQFGLWGRRRSCSCTWSKGNKEESMIFMGRFSIMDLTAAGAGAAAGGSGIEMRVGPSLWQIYGIYGIGRGKRGGALHYYEQVRKRNGVKLSWKGGKKNRIPPPKIYL